MTVVKLVAAAVAPKPPVEPQPDPLRPGEMLWRVCGAPAEGCGIRRRRFYSEKVCCPHCGSEARIAQVQAPPGRVRSKARAARAASK